MRSTVSTGVSLCAFISAQRSLSSSRNSFEEPRQPEVPAGPTEAFKKWGAATGRACPASSTVARREGKESLSRRFDDQLNPDKHIGLDDPFVLAAVGAMFGLQVGAAWRSGKATSYVAKAEEIDEGSSHDALERAVL